MQFFKHSLLIRELNFSHTENMVINFLTALNSGFFFFMTED